MELKKSHRVKNREVLKFAVTHKPNRTHIKQIHSLYLGEWWSRERTLAETKVCIQNSSLVFVGLREGELLGFARVLTDFIFKVFIFDVIVVPDQRRSGVGRKLMDSILTHPELQRVKHFELYCKPDLRRFYGRWGFRPVAKDLRLMRLNVSMKGKNKG